MAVGVVSTLGWAGETTCVSISICSCVGVRDIRFVNGDVGKGDVSAIEEVSRISIEEILQMEDGREPHRIRRQRLDQFRMCTVLCLQRIPLMLDSSPDIPQFRKLMHLPRQEIRACRKHLSIPPPIMRPMHVYRSSHTNAIPHETRPIEYRARRFPNLDQLSNSIRMQEADVRRLNLPTLMLRRAGQFRQINGQKRAVDQTVDEMVNQFAEDQDSTIRLTKEGVQRGESILRFRSPDIQVRPNLRQIRHRVPWKM